MGFTTSNLSLYHTFSKTPVDSNTSSAAAQLGNAINKSGHTVQSNEIWTESIPFFGLAATTTAIHTKFSATAKVNDLVKDSDGKIWQRNNEEYTASAKFDDLWFEKTTSIISTTKDADGNYPTAAGALVDGSYLLNSEGVPTVKYYEKRLLTILTADNNANTNSDKKASRLQIDGKWIDQFIGVTDIYLNGSAAVSYAPVLRATSSSSPMQAGPSKGYMDYCATGLILWESSAAGTEVIDCFEYVGEKLDSTVASLAKAVFGEGGADDNDASLTQKVAQNTAAIVKLNGTGEGSVAKAVADAKGAVEGTIETLKTTAVSSTSTTSEGNVTVSLGGTVSAPTVTVTQSDIASAQALATLQQTVNTHIEQAAGTYLTVEVVSALPEGDARKTNKIYLLPLDTEEGRTQNIHTEYIWTGTSWEVIGTTALDIASLEAADAALDERVTTLETTTIPAVQQSVTDLTKTVGDNKTAIEKSLADAKTEIGQTTSGLDSRLQTAEGKVKTLEETTVPALQQAITDGVAEAKGHAETKASAAEAAAKSEAATNLAAAVEQIAKDIESAKQAAISSSTVTLTQSTTDTGILVTPNGQAANSFVIGVDKTIIATVEALNALTKTVGDNKTELEGKITEASNAADKALSDAVAAIEGQISEAQTTLQGNIDGVSGALAEAKTEIKGTTDALAAAITKAQGDAETAANSYTDGQISAAKTEIKGTTDAIAADVETLKEAMGKTDDGTSIIDTITEIKSDLATTTATANSAAQSAKGDSFVSAGKTGTEIVVSTDIAAITSHVDTELVKSSAKVAQAIEAAKTAGTSAAAEALTAAQAAQQTADAKIASVTEGTNSSLLTVATDGTAVTITLDSDVATKTNISETALNGVGESSDKHVKVELGGKLGAQTVTVTTSDIASASDLATLQQTVNTHITEAAGTYLGIEVVDSLASVTEPKTNKVYLVPNSGTGTNVKDEYIYTNGKWELIGTTEVDLSAYAKSADVTAEIAAEIGKLDVAATTQNGITFSQTDGKGSLTVDGDTKLTTTDGTALVSAVAEGDEDKFVTASETLAAIKLAKPEDYVTSISGYTADGTAVTTTGAKTLKVVDDRGNTVTPDDVWGSKVSVDANGVVTLSDGFINTNGNISSTYRTRITKVENNKAICAPGGANPTPYEFNVETSKIVKGLRAFCDCEELTTFNSDLSSLTNGVEMFYNTNISSWTTSLPKLENASGMFQSSSLAWFEGDLSSLKIGDNMFFNAMSFNRLQSDLNSLESAEHMFDFTKIKSWQRDLPKLKKGGYMFANCESLTKFSGDMSLLQNGMYMFSGCSNLTSFAGDLGNLVFGHQMFAGCKLDTESLMIIADTLNTNEIPECSATQLDIGIGNATPSEEEIEYLNEIHEKGWNVYVNGSEYTPEAASVVMTLDENGEEVMTPIPFWAKPIEVKEEEAEFVADNGKYYRVVGGQFIFVDDPETYGMFTCMEDAIANMRLTPYVREEQA